MYIDVSLDLIPSGRKGDAGGYFGGGRGGGNTPVKIMYTKPSSGKFQDRAAFRILYIHVPGAKQPFTFTEANPYLYMYI